MFEIIPNFHPLRRICFIVVFSLALVVTYLPFQAIAQINPRVEQELNQLVQNGAVIYHDETGRELVAINPEKQFVPASIFKIYL